MASIRIRRPGFGVSRVAIEPCCQNGGRIYVLREGPLVETFG